MKRIVNKRIYTGYEVLEKGYIRFDRRIHEVGRMEDFVPREDDEEIEVPGDLLIPGFIEIHSHGGYGKDNMDATPEEIDRMVRTMAVREGITSYFCTTMTQSIEKIEAALANIRKAAEINPMIQGVHLEGPFISEEYKGAQNAEYIIRPDEKLVERWNEICGQRVRLITYAPEFASKEFEKWCTEHDIVLSAGHCGATYEVLKRSRASHITHLYNGQRGLHHREPGVTGFGMMADGVKAEIICDGIHIVPAMVDLAYRVRGVNGLELITDSIRAKGMPEGRSELGGQVVIVKDGQARLESGSLAGSVLKFHDAFKNIMNFTGAPVENAVRMASVNQAEEFGLKSKGALKEGKDADFLVLSKDLELVETYVLGETVEKEDLLP